MSEHTDRHSVDSTRRNVLAALGGGAAVSLAGCTGVFDDDDDENGEVDRDFIASMGANPDTFDPSVIADASSNSAVGTMCYEGLMDMDFDIANLEPALATGYEQIDDTTYRFDLREGVEFHNGDEFVAEDVRFSVERMRGTVNTATVAPFEEPTVVDDHTVEITSHEPYAPFLIDISGVPILPHGHDDISEEPAEDDFPFTEESIGTGPWLLDDFAAEDRVVLVPNEDYWHDEENPWDTVTFRVIPEQVSQEEAMQAGELHMIDNPAPFDLQQWDDVDPEPITSGGLGFDFVTFPVNVPPYNNPKFRRGMTQLIPRGDIIDAIFGGNATALAGPISPGLTTYWDADHEQQLADEWVGEDEESGLALIGEAFDEEGIEPPLDVDFITNVNRTRERWMEEIQATMDATEFFNANLDIQDFDALVPFLLDPEGAAQSSDVVGIGWTGGSDPNGHVESLLHSDFHVDKGGFNWNLYENTDVDALIEEGQRTIDVDERIQVYQDMQELLVQESPMAWMWTSDQIDIVDTTAVEGWQPYPNSSLRYWALYRPTVGVVAQPI